jgi:myo-inositol-1(or 4)-monophosphatase
VSPSDTLELLRIARSAGVAAADLLRRAKEVGRIDTKTTSRDLVTQWDHRSEAAIREVLEAQTPGVPILAEESAEENRPRAADIELRWVVDPLDGTVNFAHGLPIFGVSIALEQRGQPIVGVVCAPALGWELHARRGGGAFLGNAPLRVSQVTDLDRAMLATGFPYDRATHPQNNFAEWEYFQRHAGACRRLGAASLDLCLVARGIFDGYWEDRLAAWDFSAGALLVIEAGGRVSDLDGGPFASEDGRMVASNGALHDRIVAGLAEVRAARGRAP